MHQQVGGREITRNREAWIQGLPVYQELIVVPAKPGADRPILQADQILDEGGLFEVGAVAYEAKGLRRLWIKLAWIGNDVAKVFVEKCVVRFESDLPFVMAMVEGHGPFEISFAKPIVLKDFDG